jgi:hypothetical protein
VDPQDHKRTLLWACDSLVLCRGVPETWAATHPYDWLDEADKIKDPAHADALVRATIPDPVKELKLYEQVSAHMLHTKCGSHNPYAPCMVHATDNVCPKRFPKKACEETTLSNSKGMCELRRPAQGHVVMKGSTMYTNGDVCEYNPRDLVEEKCHSYVSICSGTKCIDYLFKYCFKGTDATILKPQRIPCNFKNENFSHKVDVHILTVDADGNPIEPIADPDVPFEVNGKILENFLIVFYKVFCFLQVIQMLMVGVKVSFFVIRNIFVFFMFLCLINIVFRP